MNVMECHRGFMAFQLEKKRRKRWKLLAFS